jgi:cobalamin transport system permease protein
MASERRRGPLSILVLAAILVLIVCPFIGMERCFPADLLSASADSTRRIIFWQFRLPRVLVGFLGGGGLAVCGMVFQAMFRNPLATPYTLGVAAGASVGAAFYVHLGLSLSLFAFSGVSLFAFLGALASITVVYSLSRLRADFSSTTTLLAGIAVTAFCSSLILFIQYVSDLTQTFRIIRWLMGGLEVAGYDAVFSLLPSLAIGMAIVFLLTRELDLLTTGNELASARGVEPQAVSRLLFLATSLTVGAIVAVCGPIGFVGMIVPHVCRYLTGVDHRYLMPATFLFGGCFLTICDTAARTAIAPAEIPVGVITSLLGGPFFLWLLVRTSDGRHPLAR